MNATHSSEAISILESIWKITDSILDGRKNDALTQPISLRHPYIFYLGHLPAFAWNQVRACGVAAIDEQYEDIFSRGIDPDVDERRKCHAHPATPDKWPSWGEVMKYREKVREGVRKMASQIPGRVLRIIAEHDAMHNETLCYMLTQHASLLPLLPVPPLRNAYEQQEEEWIQVDERKVILGACHETCNKTFSDFKWDNEYGQVTKRVKSFKAHLLPVTINQFLRFVTAGGYNRSELWRPEDWRWVQRENRRHPSSWRPCKCADNHTWHVLTMSGPVAAQGAVLWWPVYVALAEARAYASWSKARLPTEAELSILAHGAWASQEETRPRDVRLGTVSEIGAVDVVGNGWELSDTIFESFPNFQPMVEYAEYSRDFFDKHHHVLKGASFATHPLLVRDTFRNFYQARYPFVFSKFRLVRGEDDAV